MTSRPEQPHLVSLVLQSKKALQHGEQLCSLANSLSNASAQCAFDVLALDAKVKWISGAIIEQLKLAANVAKSIGEKRLQLGKQVQDWDGLRVQRTDALDNILESLGSQLVPPDFHQGSSDSSLFGSQHSDDEGHGNGRCTTESPPFHRSPASTLRVDLHSREDRRMKDRTKWKTLRDFVDDRAIEDALETMEADRTALDDILGTTDQYPETLSNTISTIRDSLPAVTPLPSVIDILTTQESVSATMAHRLESLAAHYDQMAVALRESEAGEAFSQEDLQDMNRDTDELPAIMAELEAGANYIETSHGQLANGKGAAQSYLDAQRSTLDNLDELGEIMTQMLQRQQSVEAECTEHLAGLQQHLLTLEDLYHRFLSYQTAFNRLLLEIARRRLYQEAAENIIKGMMNQLEAMTDEENQVRIEFNKENGLHLPADICLCIENPPTKWEVVPFNGENLEVLPDIDGDILAKAKDRLGNVERAGSESL